MLPFSTNKHNEIDHQSFHQVAHIRQRQNGDPFVVTGDFNNAAESAKEIVYLKDAGFDDSFRVLHPNATNVTFLFDSSASTSFMILCLFACFFQVGTFHSFVGTATGAKIDFVFTPRNTELGGPAQIIEAEIIHDNEAERYPSDHFPVLARFALP